MTKFFRLICLCIIIFVSQNTYSVKLDHVKRELSNMNCHDLLIEFIRESSMGHKFLDKKLFLDLYYERTNSESMLLTFLRLKGDAAGIIYATCELDLVRRTFYIIVPDPPVPIKIKKSYKYIPFIIEKCTPEKNVYRRGRLPD